MTKKTIALLKKEGLLEHVREWVSDGWGLDGEPEDEQVAAALLMEARTQDECVRRGESSREYPRKIRLVAREILGVVAFDDIVEAARSLFHPDNRDLSDVSEKVRAYERAVCELLGQVMFDCFGRGAGAGEPAIENVAIVAKKIGIKNPYRKFKKSGRKS